jgi:hypothetical protein
VAGRAVRHESRLARIELDEDERSPRVLFHRQLPASQSSGRRPGVLLSFFSLTRARDLKKSKCNTRDPPVADGFATANRYLRNGPFSARSRTVARKWRKTGVFPPFRDAPRVKSAVWRNQVPSKINGLV